MTLYVARVLYMYDVVVWAPGRIGYLCNGLYAVLSSGIVFRASFSKMKMYMPAAGRGYAAIDSYLNSERQSRA